MGPRPGRCPSRLSTTKAVAGKATSMMPHQRTLPGILLGIALLLSSSLAACSGEGEPAEAQETGVDSTLAAILEAAAEAPPRSAPMPTGPRLSPDQQDQQPLNIAEMGYDYVQSQHESAWGPMMAMATTITLPIIVLFFLTQRTFIQGITMSGLKG